MRGRAHEEQLTALRHQISPLISDGSGGAKLKDFTGWRPLQAAGAGMALILGGCQGTPSIQPGSAPAPQAALLASAAPELPSNAAAIGDGDVLTVSVFQEPDFSAQNVTVDAGGNIQLPMIGTVSARGLTSGELASNIEARLRGRYLVRPQVTVNLAAVNSRRVTVEGAVTQPGIYAIEPGTGLVGAMALARGPLRVARLGQVAIIRQQTDGRYIGVFDYARIRAGLDPDVLLRPGDMIIVGTSGRRQAWQDFLQAVPAIGIFSRF